MDMPGYPSPNGTQTIEAQDSKIDDDIILGTRDNQSRPHTTSISAIRPRQLAVPSFPSRSRLPATKRKPGRSARRPHRKSRSSSTDHVGAQSIKAKRSKVVTRFYQHLSPLEALPNEIVQKIATELATDGDYYNFISSSPVFASTVNGDESAVWRSRFLARYDHPIIDGCYDFSTAYKLRRLVLRTFVDFTGGLNRRLEIQLEVLRDMLIETYYNPKPWQQPPVISRNLRAFESPDTSPWITVFMLTPFPGFSDKQTWGEPNCLFESIQLTLSHLLLSPKSFLSHLTTNARDNEDLFRYDLFRVYNICKPFQTIYECLPDQAPPKFPRRSKLFPNLGLSESSEPYRQYRLDTNTLLHIRNFWHRHLIDESHAMGLITYTDMMKSLMRIGRLPQKWDKALDSKTRIPTQWFGHYSCLHPWPRFRARVEETQTCAEGWDHADPMMLDLVKSDDYADGFWPPAFSTMPAFDNTISIPALLANEEDPFHENSPRGRKSRSARKQQNHCFHNDKDGPVYIRGIAPFINTGVDKTDSADDPDQSLAAAADAQKASREKFLKYHPFNALRVRGLIHSIPAAATMNNVQNAEDVAIPGWKRIVMIMYKVNISHLINVLEHAEEDYGGVFGTQVTNQVTAANVASAMGTPASSVSTSSQANTVASTAGLPSTIQADSITTVPFLINTDPGQGQISQPTASITTSNNMIPQPATTLMAQPAPIIPLSPTDLHAHLTARLYTLLSSSSHFPSITFDAKANIQTHAAQIIALEDDYSPPQYLAWEDNSIDFAYAYEGTILPGGKIMLGRWWRCHGLFGLGDGWEVGADGEGVEITDPNSSSNTGFGDGGGDCEMVDVNGEGNQAVPTDRDEGDGLSQQATGGEPRTNGTRIQHRDLERGPFVFWC